jgi:peroxiredoxin
VDTYGVAWAGDDREFDEFVERHQLTFPQLSDDGGALYAHFGVVTQPAFVIIDPDGDTTTLRGALDDDELEAALIEATS